jgi:hypothetical protein
MIDFTESDSIGLGNSGSGPRVCTGYCFYGDYIILHMFESIAAKAYLIAISVDSNGQMAIEDDIDYSPLVSISETGGIITDGAYIYHCADNDTTSKSTFVSSFNGTNFTTHTSFDSAYAYQGQMAIGRGYLFSGGTSNPPASGVDRVVAIPLYDSIYSTEFVCIRDYNYILKGYPLFFFNERICGITYHSSNGNYIPVSLPWDPDYGFQFRHFGDSDLSFFNITYTNMLMENLNWTLYNNYICTYDYGFSNPIYEYSPALPSGIPYFSPHNVLTICSTNGLHYYEAVGDHTKFGVYDSTKEFFYYFKFGNYEFFINDDIVSGEYQLNSGNFYYFRDYTVGLYGRPTVGNNPLTTSFIDLTM